MGASERAGAAIACPVWLVRIGLVALVLAIYWPALQFGYVDFDDPDYVLENPPVRAGITVEGVQWAFTTRHAGNWHPLTWLSLMLDGSLCGDRAFGHHLMNITLHALNVLLAFSALRGMTAAPWRSALAAALLAAHPMHVESVAWITERKDVLSMLFWLLAVRAYASYARVRLEVPRRSRGLKEYGMVALWMALGLMSKGMIVTLPGVLLLLDLWPLNRLSEPIMSAAWWKRCAMLIVEKLPLLALSLACVRLTLWAQLDQGAIQEGLVLELPQRLQNVAVAYVMYVGKLFWPVNLSCLYPNPLHLGDWAWPPWQPLAAAGLVAAITILALVLCRRAPFVLTGWMWFVLAMLPVIGLVQIGRQIIADRYAYIPFIGLYIVLAWTLGAVATKSRRRAMIVGGMWAAAVVILGAMSHRQVYVWRDGETLFAHAAGVTERNWLMINNLAGVLEKAGRRDEGLVRLEQAVAICSECAWVHQHHGEMLLRAGRLYEAQQALERAIELDPNMALAHVNLGVALMQRSQANAGLEHLHRAVDLEPRNPEWRIRLAAALSVAGRSTEAIEQVEEAIRLAPRRRSEWQPMLDAIRTGATSKERVPR